MKLALSYISMLTSAPRRLTIARPIATLARWDHRESNDSVATSIAVYWA